MRGSRFITLFGAATAAASAVCAGPAWSQSPQQFDWDHPVDTSARIEGLSAYVYPSADQRRSGVRRLAATPRTAGMYGMCVTDVLTIWDADADGRQPRRASTSHSFTVVGDTSSNSTETEAIETAQACTNPAREWSFFEGSDPVNAWYGLRILDQLRRHAQDDPDAFMRSLICKEGRRDCLNDPGRMAAAIPAAISEVRHQRCNMFEVSDADTAFEVLEPGCLTLIVRIETYQNGSVDLVVNTRFATDRLQFRDPDILSVGIHVVRTIID